MIASQFISRLLIITFLFVLAGCGWVKSNSAPEPSPLPTRFSIFFGGFGGTSYNVDLKKEYLTYTTHPFGVITPKSIIIITPTKTQWLEFRQSIDHINIWQWRSLYDDPYVADGTVWSIDIAFDGHALKSFGRNAYPTDFQAYLAALKKLVGERTFQ